MNVGGCRSESGLFPNDGKPRIVATTGMVRDLVQALVADDAHVVALMGPGIDPHLFSPNREHGQLLLTSDIIVYNGLHLEANLGERIEKAGRSGKTVIAVGELLDEANLLDADGGLHDPHIWMDIQLWSEAMMLASEQLATAMPQHAESIRQRAVGYASELETLHKWGQESMQTVPESQRVLITAHDAFRYFGKRYDIEVHGVQGVSTISEAGIRDVNRLVKLIVDQKIPAVFVESSVNDAQVKAIVEGAQKSGQPVELGAMLLSDSMGRDGTPQGSYTGMMRHNIESIVTALGGSVATAQPATEDTVQHSPADPSALAADTLSTSATSDSTESLE